jgi:hypothetical protein
MQTARGALDRSIKHTRVHDRNAIASNIRTRENLARRRSANDDMGFWRIFRSFGQNNLL